MGYSTDFTGGLSLNNPAEPWQIEYINNFNQTRRMKRDVKKLMRIFKGKHGLPFINNDKVLSREQEGRKRLAIIELTELGFDVSLNKKAQSKVKPEDVYGIEGEFFIGGTGFMGQDHDATIIEFNHPPVTQPGLWCQWILNSTGTGLEWDGNEKFYDYIEWLNYLIKNFFEPWGIKLNGKIKWSGEDRKDTGTITVKDNIVKTTKNKR